MQLLKVPFGILGPVIVMFTTVGCYSLSNEVFSIYVFIAFGILGYILRKLKFEPGPMIMSFILAPLIENAFRQALLMSGGRYGYFCDPANFRHANGSIRPGVGLADCIRL